MHDKLKNAPGLYLVGFMGCGKSTVGKLLAKRLGWDFIDLDSRIEEEAGATIAEIFEQRGEAEFRSMERRALLCQTAQVKSGEPRVIALGGGAFAQPGNREAVDAAGLSIWIECPLEELWERVARSRERPLARGRDDFEALYNERRPHYEKADFRVLSGPESPETVVASILKLSLL